MKKSIFSAALLAAMFAGGFAFAEQTTGAIKSADEANHTVTLEDGTVFTFEKDAKFFEMLGGYRPGDKVTIDWSMVGDQHVATAMSPDFSAGASGKIKAIDEAAKTVTLEDGKVYTFQNSKGETVNLGGFKAGDEVTIIAVKEGDTNVGQAITAHSALEVTGKVKAVDEAAKTVTLEDGKVYTFDDAEKAKIGGYKPGDMVKIIAVQVGHTNMGESISPAG
ncbi:MAG: DUF1344 domain-containing protein [Defluviimonas sp.]|uniref:DUF1344 domain-containing protein n=1 Tax=Albidovulum sp. TaxID=1872424 RepID=UPI001E0DACDA|nr:DUF1344 domain-containing protein [Paracoccaceae bacterium]MCC0065021.1 DUF1344 domain-containing protein [Defluviimonas sp.]